MTYDQYHFIVSYEILGKLPAKTTTLKYGLLHSLIIAKDVLLFHDIKLKDFEDVHAGFRAARNLLKNERLMCVLI